MSKKNLTILLSIALIIAFFFPFVSSGSYNFSAFDIVFDRVEGLGQGGKSLYVSLLVPLGALLLLIGAVTNDHFTRSGFVLWMPLIGVLYLVVMLYINGSEALTVSELIGWLSYGFWISLIAAIILPFLKRSL